APVNLTVDRTEAELQFLMANDSDLFNRWQAANDYATRVLLQAMEAIRKGGRPAQPKAFIDALSVTIGNDALETGYRAQMLYLPSESDLARIVGKNVDPLAIHKARNTLRKAIGTQLHDTLAGTYRRMEVKGPYSPDPEPAGRRALRNVALG